MTFFSTIRSGSTLSNEPTPNNLGLPSASFLNTSKGHGKKLTGPYTLATEYAPGRKNLSNLCLSQLRFASLKIGLA